MSLEEIRRERARKWEGERNVEPLANVAHAALPRSRSPQTAYENVPTSLRVLSWNLDGLDTKSSEEDMLGRTLWVLNEINENKPHVVFLQELVDFNFSIVESKVRNSFHVFKQEYSGMPYFVAILVHKPTMTINLTADSPMDLPFPTSKMGRGAVYVEVALKELSYLRFGLLCTHLESENKSARERVNQFHVCYGFCRARVSTKEVDYVIFGGDTNLRDSELIDLPGLPDCWELAGSPFEHRYTWDLCRNQNAVENGRARCRFDRLYLYGDNSLERTGSSQRVTTKSFKLLGTDRIPGLNRHASDHFGIMVDFELMNQPEENVIINLDQD